MKSTGSSPTGGSWLSLRSRLVSSRSSPHTRSAGHYRTPGERLDPAARAGSSTGKTSTDPRPSSRTDRPGFEVSVKPSLAEASPRIVGR
jgi:hypothetical protein